MVVLIWALMFLCITICQRYIAGGIIPGMIYYSAFFAIGGALTALWYKTKYKVNEKILYRKISKYGEYGIAQKLFHKYETKSKKLRLHETTFLVNYFVNQSDYKGKIKSKGAYVVKIVDNIENNGFVIYKEVEENHYSPSYFKVTLPVNSIYNINVDESDYFAGIGCELLFKNEVVSFSTDNQNNNINPNAVEQEKINENVQTVKEEKCITEDKKFDIKYLYNKLSGCPQSLTGAELGILIDDFFKRSKCLLDNGNGGNYKITFKSAENTFNGVLIVNIKDKKVILFKILQKNGSTIELKIDDECSIYGISCNVVKNTNEVSKNSIEEKLNSLEKLEKLKSNNAISDEEFNKLKDEIIKM